MNSMNFIFLDQDENIIGTSRKAHVCRVNEGQYTAELAFEPSSAFSIKDSSYVGFEDIDGNFVFYEIDNAAVGTFDRLIHITATNAAITELMEEIVEGKAVTNVMAGFATNYVLQGTRWSLRSAEDTVTFSDLYYFRNVWESLCMIEEKTGCAFQFSWTISGNQITGRYVDVKARHGSNRGKRFTYRKDLQEIKVVEDRTGIRTLLYGRGKGEEVGTNSNGDPTYGRRITFENVVWSKAAGDPMDKPQGQIFLEDTEATQSFGIGAKGSKRPRKGIAVFEQCTDPEELIQLTYEALQLAKAPKLTITGKVIDLERYGGFSHESVRFGDDVLVIADEWNVQYQNRITDLIRDYLNPMNTDVTIGEHVATSTRTTADLTSQMNIIKEQAQIGSSIAGANPGLLKGVLDTMATKIISSGTGFTTDPVDGSFIFTSSDGKSAVKVTGGGILIADSRIGDVWQWKTALAGSGIVADTITAGTINATLIKIFGSDQFYWDANNIYVVDPDSPRRQIRIGQYDGVNYGVAFTSDGGETWKTAIGFDGINGSTLDLSANETIILAAGAAQTAQDSVNSLLSYFQITEDGLYALPAANAENTVKTRVSYGGFDVIDAQGRVTNSLGDKYNRIGKLTVYATTDGGIAFYARGEES